VYKEKFLDGDGCIVFANIKNKTKGNLDGRHVMVIGSINHS